MSESTQRLTNDHEKTSVDVIAKTSEPERGSFLPTDCIKENGPSVMPNHRSESWRPAAPYNAKSHA